MKPRRKRGFSGHPVARRARPVLTARRLPERSRVSIKSAGLRSCSRLGDRSFTNVAGASLTVPRRVLVKRPRKPEISGAEHEARQSCGRRPVTEQPPRDSKERESPKHRRERKNHSRRAKTRSLRTRCLHGRSPAPRLTRPCAALSMTPAHECNLGSTRSTTGFDS